MKICVKCSVPFEGRRCKPCHVLASTKCRKANSALYRGHADLWYDINKDKRHLTMKTYQQANPGKINAINAKRRAARKNATPIWLNKDQINDIEEFYIQASELSWLSESPLEVDHIVPLQGKEICGLHVPWNLQILPKSMNIKKGNKI